MNCAVSVIVPVYGTEKYLEKCLRSILQQTLKNIEIICIDDASKDNSWSIIEKISRYDKRLKGIRHKKNMSQAAARNTGLDAADGEYISFIDSDDWIQENFLEKLYYSAIKEHAEIASGYAIVIEEESNNWIELWGSEHFGKTGVYIKKQINDLIIKAAYNSACWNKIYKKEFIENRRFRFDPEMKGTEDQYFVIEAMSHANKILICDAIYFYLKRRSSTMTRTDAEYFFSWNKTYSKVIDHLNILPLDYYVYNIIVRTLKSTMQYRYTLIPDANIANEFLIQLKSTEQKIKHY